MLTMNGMPRCSATWAMAMLWPESKAPTIMCTPPSMAFSACVRATSGLVSVS